MCRWIARWYVGLYPHDEPKFNRISNTAHRAEDGKRHPRCGVFLLVAALLAGEFDAGGALLGLQAVWRATFAASCLDPRIALLDGQGLLGHGLADQALGLLAHRLLVHPPHLS